MARPGLMRHRKFARLARLIGSEVLARGHLELLWEVAYENGDDLVGDAGDLEHLARWEGSPGVLANALVESGFFDLDADQYRVHDLWDHAPDYVRRRRQRETERQAKGAGLASASVTDQSATGQCPQNDGHRPPNGRTRAPAPAPAPSPSQPPNPHGRLAGSSDDREPEPFILLRSSLTERLGAPRMIGVGRDRARVEASFGRWTDRGLDELVVNECVRIAKEKGETPSNLAWWAGWIDTVPDRDLDRYAEVGRDTG